MKALFVNGGPRKQWSTAQMLEQAMQGAADAGAEVEMVHLYDDAFKGCVSCFACKLKNAKTNGLCAYKDALTPILEKAREADVLVMGSPIYFSHPTGPVRSFMERLMFPVLTYNAKVDPETGAMKSTILNKTVPTAMIYTLGCTENMLSECHYHEMFAETEKFFNMLFGYGETLYSYSTYQFDDYEKYDVAEFVEPFRAKHREQQWPKDLQNAYELGKRLVQKAKKS